jgi:hypothetical protein
MIAHGNVNKFTIFMGGLKAKIASWKQEGVFDKHLASAFRRRSRLLMAKLRPHLKKLKNNETTSEEGRPLMWRTQMNSLFF